MDPLKGKHGEPSKGGGSLKGVTRSVTRRPSSVSPPSTAFIHIVHDDEQDVPIEGFSASQWESKATPRTLEKLRRDYHIPTSVELRIPSPDENMATPLKDCVALYPSLFKARVKLPLDPFIRFFFRSFNVVLTQLSPAIYKAILGHYVLWKRLGI